MKTGLMEQKRVEIFHIHTHTNTQREKIKSLVMVVVVNVIASLGADIKSLHITFSESVEVEKTKRRYLLLFGRFECGGK